MFLCKIFLKNVKFAPIRKYFIEMYSSSRVFFARVKLLNFIKIVS